MSEGKPLIKCPHCFTWLDEDSIGVVVFSQATVFHCPVCKKTISLEPKF